MENRKELTTFERGMIVGLNKGNHGVSEISRILNIPKQTCHNVIKKYCEEGLTDTLPRSGRPALLTEREERTLIHQVKENRKASVEDITEILTNLALLKLVLALPDVYYTSMII